MKICRMAMVQMNPTVGDLDGNVRAITRWIKEARQAKASVVVFPELAVTGYPPEDLVLRPQFLQDTARALQHCVAACRGLTAIIGFVEQGGPVTHRVGPAVVPSGQTIIFNAAAIIHDRQVFATYQKMLLPNYGVFDESRYFSPGRTPLVCVRDNVSIGVNICEDIWYPEGPTRSQVALGGAELIVNINASPYHMGKSHLREQMLAERARENGVVVSYTNMVGGQDELVFDGNSLLIDRHGHVIGRAKAFEEDMLLADVVIEKPIRRKKDSHTSRVSSSRAVKRVTLPGLGYSRPVPMPSCSSRIVPALSPLAEVYQALVLGVRDYVRKNRFARVVIGLSGGIDSALTAVIAVDALGPSSVLGVVMPSPFTSRASREDAQAVIKALGIESLRLSITSIWKRYLSTLSKVFAGTPFDATEENLQARIRGNLLMALSNKFGYLVLTTGNKSEMSVGYATLYGDMAGGFAVIKDVPKTLVYELARFRNQQAERDGGRILIPKRVFERPPSAELKPNQTDQDVLPPYAELDRIVAAYVEEDRSPEEIVQMGFSRTTVQRVLSLVDQSEYKRRQAPIGIKITRRALGKDRRMPITNWYSWPRFWRRSARQEKTI
ncbi:MAG: NAD+ synthase [Nitrospirae bacterium]|nr:MAG: NAD+ synthase [Nitrospirota bacterium]